MIRFHHLLLTISVLFLFLFLPENRVFAQAETETDSIPEDTLNIPQKIVIGVKESPPFMYKNEDGDYEGISLQLWDIIALKLGIEYSFREMTLDELLQNLETDSIDLCINPLTVTSSRIRRFDFTQPFFTTHSAVAMRSTGNKGLFTYLKQFFSLDFLKIILLLGLVLMIFGTLTWWFERKKNPEEFENNIRGLWSGLWWSAVTMTTVGYGDKSPRSTGGRFIALIWMFTAVIIISSFTASISSALTVEQLGDNLKDITDLRNIKVGTVGSSATETFLEHNYIKTINFDSPPDGLKALAEKKIDAFVYDLPILKWYLEALELEDVRILPNKFNPQYYSFSLPKGSELEPAINPILLRELEEVNWKLILSEFGLNNF